MFFLEASALNTVTRQTSSFTPNTFLSNATKLKVWVISHECGRDVRGYLSNMLWISVSHAQNGYIELAGGFLSGNGLFIRVEVCWSGIVDLASKTSLRTAVPPLPCEDTLEKVLSVKQQARSSPDTVYSLRLWASRPAELWEICCCWLTGMLVASCHGSCINMLRQHRDSSFSSFTKWILSRPGGWSCASGEFHSTLARWWSQSNTWRLLGHRSFYYLPCCLVNDDLVIDSICHSFL